MAVKTAYMKSEYMKSAYIRPAARPGAARGLGFYWGGHTAQVVGECVVRERISSSPRCGALTYALLLKIWRDKPKLIRFSDLHRFATYIGTAEWIRDSLVKLQALTRAARGLYRVDLSRVLKLLNECRVVPVRSRRRPYSPEAESLLRQVQGASGKTHGTRSAVPSAHTPGPGRASANGSSPVLLRLDNVRYRTGGGAVVQSRELFTLRQAVNLAGARSLVYAEYRLQVYAPELASLLKGRYVLKLYVNSRKDPPGYVAVEFVPLRRQFAREWLSRGVPVQNLSEALSLADSALRLASSYAEQAVALSMAGV
jgi:hypothetical protein